MENHGYGQVAGNPDLPYTNEPVASANTASNYFAIAHPSLTNYLLRRPPLTTLMRRRGLQQDAQAKGLLRNAASRK